MAVMRVYTDIEYESLPPGFDAQKVSDMIFGYVHGTLIPLLDIKATGQLEADRFEKPHKHTEGCTKCNEAMYDGRY